jgi:hypothetical protein
VDYQSKKQAREGLENVKSEFNSEIFEGNEYWFGEIAKHKIQNITYFVPAFDEFIISYKDRSASLRNDFLKTAITNNGIFKPMILANGKVIGTWKRTLKKNEVLIETE